MFSDNVHTVWGAALNDYIEILPGVVFAREVLMPSYGLAIVPPGAVAQPVHAGRQPGVGRASLSPLNEAVLEAGQLDLWPQDD